MGVATVLKWAESIRSGGAILDVGCGSGMPISAALIGRGFVVSGVDASPTLVAAFRRRFPSTEVICEPAETSAFFGRTFDAAVAIGLLFLLPANVQRRLIHRIAGTLNAEGRLLFTAPQQACRWTDITTGGRSLSLGVMEYRRTLADAGMSLVDTYVDEGENNYYEARKTAS